MILNHGVSTFYIMTINKHKRANSYAIIVILNGMQFDMICFHRIVTPIFTRLAVQSLAFFHNCSFLYDEQKLFNIKLRNCFDRNRERKNMLRSIEELKQSYVCIFRYLKYFEKVKFTLLEFLNVQSI